jgi:predicted DNA-binding transcriptional regulator AlpA
LRFVNISPHKTTDRAIFDDRTNQDRPTKFLAQPISGLGLAISPRKLWGMTASGEIPHIRLGRCVRYPVNDLLRWIDYQKKGGNE